MYMCECLCIVRGKTVKGLVNPANNAQFAKIFPTNTHNKCSETTEDLASDLLKFSSPFALLVAILPIQNFPMCGMCVYVFSCMYILHCTV